MEEEATDDGLPMFNEYKKLGGRRNRESYEKMQEEFIAHTYYLLIWATVAWRMLTMNPSCKMGDGFITTGRQRGKVLKKQLGVRNLGYFSQ